VLDDDGILVLQISYTPLMLEQMAFDNICHEHIYYWSLSGVKELFERHDFRVVDCDLNDTNGGSMRIYLQKNTSNVASFGSGPLRDVFNFRVKALLEYEQAHYDLSDPALWDQFKQRLDHLREDVVGFIRSERAKGKTVWAYGASTKGNTLLQYFGLDQNDIVGIAERNPHKVGLRTIGSNIPIYSEADMRAAQPDYLLILPWAFINEFRSRESEFFKNGGAFIVPCPTFEIIRG
jgi:NDP-4-keto-2,6-dideoxyhexose 3-C-methyltransferase